MKIFRNLLIQFLLFCGLVLYLVLKPGPNYSRDDALARSFKMPLTALLESGKEHAPLVGLYTGTLFEGDKICMFYPYPGIQQSVTAAQRLARYFPEHVEEIAAMELRYAYPEWLVAIAGKEGVTAVMGTKRIGEKSYIKVEKTYIDAKGVARQQGSAAEGNACFSFDAAIVRVEKDGTRPPVLVLTERPQPSTP